MKCFFDEPNSGCNQMNSAEFVNRMLMLCNVKCVHGKPCNATQSPNLSPLKTRICYGRKMRAALGKPVITVLQAGDVCKQLCECHLRFNKTTAVQEASWLSCDIWEYPQPAPWHCGEQMPRRLHELKAKALKQREYNSYCNFGWAKSQLYIDHACGSHQIVMVLMVVW